MGVGARVGPLGQSTRDGDRMSRNSSSANVTHRHRERSLGPGPGASETTAVRPGAGAPHTQRLSARAKPPGWAGPRNEPLGPPKRGPRAPAGRGGPGAAVLWLHCNLAPRGRGGLALGRLGQGSSGLRGQDARIVRCSGDCRYLMAPLRGRPARLRGFSAVCSAPSVAVRAVAGLPALTSLPSGRKILGLI